MLHLSHTLANHSPICIDDEKSIRAHKLHHEETYAVYPVTISQYTLENCFCCCCFTKLPEWHNNVIICNILVRRSGKLNVYIVANCTLHMHIAARINSISMCFVNLHPIGLRIYGYTDIYIYRFTGLSMGGCARISHHQFVGECCVHVAKK